MGRPAERGGALVEFALILPLLAVMVLGTLDFGRVFYTAMAVSNAARAGAQYGASTVARSSDTTTMANIAKAAANTDIGTVVASAARSCTCTVSGTTTTIACTATCTGTTRIYVTVTAQKLFTTITQFPGFPHSVSVVRGATMRAE